MQKMDQLWRNGIINEVDFLNIYQPQSLLLIYTTPLCKTLVKVPSLGDLQLHKNPRSETVDSGFIYNAIFPRMIKFRRVH